MKERRMSFSQNDVDVFVAALASGEAVPGGGGASALVGAAGIALGSMVCNLTVGKAKYADVSDEVSEIRAKADAIRIELLRLIDADAEAFLPLAQAYGIPKDDPDRPAILEKALDIACATPLEIMRTLSEAITLLSRLSEIGSALALSDVGVGATCCRAALEGASLNVFINTQLMTDRSHALALEHEADELLEEYTKQADTTYRRVFERLRKRG
jgi:methenyltetrahydrofolate cyclohydrolase